MGKTKPDTKNTQPNMVNPIDLFLTISFLSLASYMAILYLRQKVFNHPISEAKDSHHIILVNERLGLCLNHRTVFGFNVNLFGLACLYIQTLNFSCDNRFSDFSIL